MLNYIFSGGPRGCIGKSLALTEMKVLMIKFVQRYENLVETKREDRAFELQTTYKMISKEVILTKAKH